MTSTAAPYHLPLTIPDLLHLVFPAFRVLILIPLFFALVLPRVVYAPISADEDADESAANESSFLVPAGGVLPSSGLSPVPGFAGEASKYGTFQAAHPAIPPSGPVTRAPTPAPSHAADKVYFTVNKIKYSANMPFDSLTGSPKLPSILHGVSFSDASSASLHIYGRRKASRFNSLL